MNLRSLRRFLATAHFDHFLGRHQHVAELVLHAGARNPLLERSSD